MNLTATRVAVALRGMAAPVSLAPVAVRFPVAASANVAGAVWVAPAVRVTVAPSVAAAGACWVPPAVSVAAASTARWAVGVEPVGVNADLGQEEAQSPAPILGPVLPAPA
jgi:hypothetical protein